MSIPQLLIVLSIALGLLTVISVFIYTVRKLPKYHDYTQQNISRPLYQTNRE